ncbi:PapD-like protein [Zychaea mexicana]|uniref:PapD-like protein n=1 Tax=Zychaea mexicana TaxID=64656 RepID=UPI0022FE719E|nr:PapD-like protein [Zychaea mexicana]KAI9492495.1 PapD-like protein [Zychaea mexicana]
MAVVLTPSSYLTFTRPFAHPVATESICIQNPGKIPVTFKVKTTAPKQYCVKPNTGKIEPNEQVVVQVFLQPMKEKFVEGYKCKDKFLIQTAEIKPTGQHNNSSSVSMAEMWQRIETEEKDKIYRHKIKCVVSPPGPSRRQSEPVKDKTARQQDERMHVLRSDTVDTLPMKDAPSSPSASSTNTASTTEEENLMHQQHEERVAAVQEENIRLLKQVANAQESIKQLRQELMLATQKQHEAEERCRQYKEAVLQDLAEQEEQEKQQQQQQQETDISSSNSNGTGEQQQMQHIKSSNSSSRRRRQRLALMLQEHRPSIEEDGHPVAVAWTAAALTFGLAFYLFC